MKLRIVSPENFFEYEVAWVELNTQTAGNYVIQSGHIPMITSLAQGKPLFFRLQNGKQESVIITTGTAEVTRDGVLILIES